MSDLPNSLSLLNTLHAPLPTSTPKPAVTYVPPPTTRLFPELSNHVADSTQSQQTQSQHASFSTTLVANYADFISLLALFIIVYRTYRYISRRRNGLVGPSFAPRLIKFWSLYGIIQFSSQILSLYLSPLQADWFISATRALILVLLITGPRLRIAEVLYDRRLVPFFETYAPEIERQFAVARKHWDELNEAFRELATYLLKRIAVGGLSNAVAVPSAEEESHASNVQHPRTSDRERGARLPKETAVFPTGRTFFAGEAEQRAETVINARAGSLGGAIQVAVPEVPRPVYEDARAMRERFRNRLKKGKTGKSPPG